MSLEKTTLFLYPDSIRKLKAIYVTEHYTTVVMVIIHEDRLSALLPFFSVSRKHCIPSIQPAGRVVGELK